MNLLYTPLGFFIGLIGTLVGAGGGFLLIPILLFLHPTLPPEQLTGISLAVIFLNTSSGTWAYAKKGRIDWQAWRSFTLVAIPGALLGAFATSYLSREKFNFIFGVFLLVMSIYLFLKKAPSQKIIDSNKGTPHVTGYSPGLAQAISFFTGFISSLIGIGGGIIHVPAMVRLLHFPAHIATATSHAILAVTSFMGLMVHIYQSNLQQSWVMIFLLAPGLIIGAQFGARLSEKLKAQMILRLLSIALFTVAIRLLLK